MSYVVNHAVDGRGKPVEQTVGLLCNGVEYRMHIRRRTGDDLQDVGRRGLPLQRLLSLVEQPRVLYGDHGLIGESLEE